MHRSRQFASLLLAAVAVALLVAWVTSYRTARMVYHSRWHESPAGHTEDARWLISNFGSFGIAWRRQHTPVNGRPLPGPSHEVGAFPANEARFSNVHALGILPWHWFDYHNATTALGSSPVTDGSLFVPYWSVTLVAVLLSAAVYPRHHPGRGDP